MFCRHLSRLKKKLVDFIMELSENVFFIHFLPYYDNLLQGILTTSYFAKDLVTNQIHILFSV